LGEGGKQPRGGGSFILKKGEGVALLGIFGELGRRGEGLSFKRRGSRGHLLLGRRGGEILAVKKKRVSIIVKGCRIKEVSRGGPAQSIKHGRPTNAQGEDLGEREQGEVKNKGERRQSGATTTIIG